MKVGSISICKQLDVIVDKTNRGIVWRHNHLTTTKKYAKSIDELLTGKTYGLLTKREGIG